jgi:Uma2 family endonuclease
MPVMAPPMPPPSAPSYTPEDLLQLEDAVKYELVDGQLVERHMGMESSAVAANIVVELGAFLKTQRLGKLFDSEASYQCFPSDPGKVRRPDVSFIRQGRLADDKPPRGHSRIAPDLAVEVVSPNDSAYEIAEKVADYLAAGVPLVWEVNPHGKFVLIHRPRSSPLGPITSLTDADTISGEEVLPGFACPVRDFFI